MPASISRRTVGRVKPRPAKATLPRTPDIEDRLAELTARVDQITRDMNVQFTRIAQLQADLDVIRGAWSRVPSKRDV